MPTGNMTFLYTTWKRLQAQNISMLDMSMLLEKCHEALWLDHSLAVFCWIFVFFGDEKLVFSSIWAALGLFHCFFLWRCIGRSWGAVNLIRAGPWISLYLLAFWGEMV